MTLTFSNAVRWVPCSQAASPAMNSPIPREKSELALEGEAWAWMVAGVLAGDAASCAEFDGEHSPDGFPINGEMIRHGQRYVEIVTRHGEPIRVEQDVTVFGGLVRGRPDAACVSDGDRLYVYDGKYGFKLVEPQENYQLLLAAMAFVLPHHRLISMEIFQPRPYHPAGQHRKWVIDQDELRRWENHLYARALATVPSREHTPQAVAGDHCDHCPRRASCPTLDANVYRQYEMISSPHQARPIGPVDLGERLKFLHSARKLLAASITGTEAEIEGMIKSGVFVPGWAREPSEGHAEWTVDAALIKMLTGVDPSETTLKTPAALIREGASEIAVKAITRRPSRGLRLVEANSKLAERIFGK